MLYANATNRIIFNCCEFCFYIAVGDNAIPAFRFYQSAQSRFPLEALSEAASALSADNSDIEDDVAETTCADIGDCDL
ncbi:hypothetical protein FQA39_LY00273 [Lamprigera yunnana]|nr:hypothetical protein FQA39_LY00273 [Lamprigera yunnana]